MVMGDASWMRMLFLTNVNKPQSRVGVKGLYGRDAQGVKVMCFGWCSFSPLLGIGFRCRLICGNEAKQ